MALGSRAQPPACEPGVPFCRVILQRTSEFAITAARNKRMTHATRACASERNAVAVGDNDPQKCTDFPG
jgi:hypothetical protein